MCPPAPAGGFSTVTAGVILTRGADTEVACASDSADLSTLLSPLFLHNPFARLSAFLFLLLFHVLSLSVLGHFNIGFGYQKKNQPTAVYIDIETKS